MDLRSVKPGLAAVSHPMFMIHPRTGEMITPLGYTKYGKPCWPVMGGAPEDDDSGKGDDDSDDDSDEDEEDEDEDNDEDEDKDDDGDDEKAKGKKNPKAKIKALEEEKDRHFRNARKAKKRAETAEAELAAIKAKYENQENDDEDDDKDEKGKDKKVKPKVIVDDSKVKAAEAAATKLRVENAFLRVNEVSWIKPEQALALMLSDDDYEIEFDDDGKVDRKSLRAELKRFAKANPHLVKKVAPKDDEDKDADSGGTGQRQSAPQMNGKRKGKKTEPTRDDLAKKFPALNRLRLP